MMGLMSNDLLSAPISKRSVSKYAAVVTSSSGCLAYMPVISVSFSAGYMTAWMRCRDMLPCSRLFSLLASIVGRESEKKLWIPIIAIIPVKSVVDALATSVQRLYGFSSMAALPVLGLFGQRFNSSTGMAAAFLSAVRRLAA